jgi:hypothetical protein
MFLQFWRKSGILIPDLYLYSIKIQTNINQNGYKNTRENHKFFKRILGIFFVFLIKLYNVILYNLIYWVWAQPNSVG